MRRLLRFQNKTIQVADIHKLIWHRKHQAFVLFDKQDKLLGFWKLDGEWLDVKKDYDIISSFVFEQSYEIEFDVLVTASASPVEEGEFLVMDVARVLAEEPIELCAS